MMRFLKALAFFLFATVIMAFLAVGALYAYRDSLILHFVHSEGPHHFAKLQIRSLTTRPVGPLSFDIEGLEFQMTPDSPTLTAQKIGGLTPSTALELYHDYLEFEKTGRSNRLSLRFRVHDLTVTMPQSKNAAAQTDQQQTGPSQGHSPIDAIHSATWPFQFDTEIELKNVTVQSPDVSMNRATGIIKASTDSDIKSGALKISSQGQVALAVSTGENRSLPIRSEWDFVAANSTLKIKRFQFGVLGLNTTGSGEFDFKKKDLNIQVAGKAADLSVVPLEKAESDALGLTGRLQGAFDFKLELKGGYDSEIDATGSVGLKGGVLPFTLNRDQPIDVFIKGPVALDVELPFALKFDVQKKSLESMTVELASIRMDASAADMRISEYLRKPVAIPFRLRTQVAAEGKAVDISTFQFELANLFATLKGKTSLDPQEKSNLEFNLNLPSLNGWPKLIPKIAAIDMGAVKGQIDLNSAQGEIRSQGRIEGSLAKPLDLAFNIQTFDLKSLQFPINFPILGGHISGVLKGSSHAVAQRNSESIHITESNGDFNFDDLEIEIPDKLTKAARVPLSLNWRASGTPETVKLERMQVYSRDTVIGLQGVIHPQSRAIEAIAKGKGSLTEIYSLTPLSHGLRSKIKEGTFNGDFKLSGTWNSQKPTDSNLATVGKVSLRVPLIKVLDTKTAIRKSDGKKTETLTPDSPSSTSKSELPSILDSALFRRAKVDIDTKVDALELDGILIKNLTSQTSIANTQIRSSGTIASIFGGQAAWKDFTLSQLSPRDVAKVKTQGRVEAKGLKLNDILNAFKPDLAKQSTGVLQTAFQFTLYPFSEKSLIESIESNGGFTLDGFRMSTEPIERVIKSSLETKLSSLPGAKQWLQSQPVTTSSVSVSQLSSTYLFKNGIMTLKDLRSKTNQDDEILLNGTISTKDFAVDLKGDAKLKNVGIGGPFREANNDSKGRLVVPLVLRGPLTSPSAEIATEALTKMTEKTVQFEAKKLRHSVESRLKSEAQKEVQKKTNEAADRLKEELKKRGLSL